jgi:hypothetical protein
MNNNDTIHGLIKYAGNYENTHKCSFKADINSSVVTYTPDEIISYRFNDGKYFISKKINPSDTSNIFFEFLFDGIVDLYDYFDETGAHYLISKSNNTIQELKNETKTLMVNGVEYKKESREYIGLLKSVFVESPSLLKKTESLSLNFNPLIQIAEEYHREVCPNEECITYARKKIRTKFSPALMAGYFTSDLLLGEVRDVLQRFVLPPLGKGIHLGTYLNIKDEFLSRNFSVEAGISISNSNRSTNESSLQIINLSVPLQLKFSKQVKKLDLSVFTGLSYNNLLKFEYTSTSYGDFKIISDKKRLGFIGGLEVGSKTIPLFFQFRYEKNSGDHFGQWSGTNYGQWDGLKYDPVRAKSLLIVKDVNLIFLVGLKL